MPGQDLRLWLSLRAIEQHYTILSEFAVENNYVAAAASCRHVAIAAGIPPVTFYGDAEDRCRQDRGGGARRRITLHRDMLP